MDSTVTMEFGVAHKNRSYSRLLGLVILPRLGRCTQLTDNHLLCLEFDNIANNVKLVSYAIVIIINIITLLMMKDEQGSNGQGNKSATILDAL